MVLFPPLQFLPLKASASARPPSRCLPPYCPTTYHGMMPSLISLPRYTFVLGTVLDYSPPLLCLLSGYNILVATPPPLLQLCHDRVHSPHQNSI